jgi:hypothetical protein
LRIQPAPRQIGQISDGSAGRPGSAAGAGAERTVHLLAGFSFLALDLALGVDQRADLIHTLGQCGDHIPDQQLIRLCQESVQAFFWSPVDHASAVNGR